MQASKEKALDDYGLAVSRQQGSSRLEAILPAAVDGRVDRLLVQQGARQWGVFDADKRTVSFNEAPTKENEDLLNTAATETCLTQGSVYLLPRDRMPEGAPIAAIYRY